MQTPQLLPRLVTEEPPKPSRSLFSFLRAKNKRTNFAPEAERKSMAETAKDDALRLCPWASDDKSSWSRVLKSLNRLASEEHVLSGDEIKFDFDDPDLLESDKYLLEKLESLQVQPEASDTESVFQTTLSLAPTIHTNELVTESKPFYHSCTLSLPTKPSPQSSSSSLLLTTVSRPEVRLNCSSQTVYSVRNAKAESTTPMQDFLALNNTVNSKGQTIFTEKRDGKYYMWATHHSNRANDPEKYWFYVVRTSFVGTDDELTAVIFAELTPKTGWVYDADMHYKGHFYLVKVKPMSEKRAFDSSMQANPPRAHSMIFVNKIQGHLPMFEFHSGQPFVSYKDPKLNYHLHWVDWEHQRLWQICSIKPFHSPNWNASQTRPIPILFNGGLYLIESSQIVKCYLSYDGDVPRLVSMRKWSYDTPLASKAILWADHIDAKHVVLHHSEGYHVYDLEKKQHYESLLNKDRPSLWSLVDGKIHKFGYTQTLLDKIEASVARRKLQVGDRVDF
ncbi:hypothetical protein CJU89_1604 [Yarrowia sp. B02]|nr:hypothetical protein CJU89_1604 [Yarrowia sp. B02]